MVALAVRRNGRIRAGFPVDDSDCPKVAERNYAEALEQAIRFVADETGVAAENVASETRGGRPLVVDAGASGRSREDVWTIEEVAS